MALKFRRGTAAQKSGSLAFGEPYVNTTLGTLQVGLDTGDVTLTSVGATTQFEIQSVSASAFVSASSIYSTNGITGSIAATNGVVSGSSQVSYVGLSNIPNGIISSSAQIDTLFNIDGIVSSSAQVTPLLPTGVVSGSSQIIYANISSIPAGIVSGSSQITPLLPTGTLSGSAQIATLGFATTESNTLNGIQYITGALEIYSASNSEIRLYNGTTGIQYHIKNRDTGNFQIHNGTTDKILFRFESASFEEGNQHASFFGELYVSKSVTAQSFTGSIAATNGVVSGSSQITYTDISSIPSAIVSGSEQVVGILSSLNSYTSSNNTANDTQNSRLTNLETTSASVNGHIVDINSKTGSYAKTNSTNIFTGNQTITGSLYITQDLVVQGSSSIQNITSSNLTIGAAFVTLNALTPSSNFAGIKVVDSGSTFTTASFIYDGLNNNWVFEKANVGSSDTSVAIFGPISTNGLGTELGLTQNKLPKAVSSHGHHIGDSNITDTGTLITLGSNTTITGTLSATGTTLVSGSSQIAYASISSIPAGIVSGSGQIDGASLGSNKTITVGSTSITLGGTATTIAGLTSVTSTGFTGALTGNASTATTAGTVTTAAQSAITSVGTLTSLTVSGATATGALTVTGAITATGDITAFFTSDKRHKNNIQTIPNALEKVLKLNGVTWEWNDDVHEVTKSTPKTGLIAQEVQEVLPEVVKTRDDGFLALDYSKMMGLMVEAIKEQQTQIHNLTLEIENLKKQKGL